METQLLGQEEAIEICEKALENPNTQIRLFGKPNVAGERRMGVCLARAASIELARNLANTAAANIKSTL